MHISEGFLPPAQAAAWAVVAAPFVVHGVRAVVKRSEEHPETKTLLAAAGALTFALSAVKLPALAGTSSHPTGTGAGAVLFKPPVMAFLGTIVLLFQAILLAHGGLTTLGANVFSMAVVGPWIGYGTWLLLRRFSAVAGIFCAMALANLSTYCVTSFQLALAYPDPASGVTGALVKYLGFFAANQIPLALAEGVLGVLLFNFLAKVATPQLITLGVVPDQSQAAEEVAA